MTPPDTPPDETAEHAKELADWRPWAARAVVLSFATLAGLSVVLLTWLSEHALAAFFALSAYSPWLTLVWTPTLTAALVWCTNRYFAGTAGSGIPQVLASLDVQTPPEQRHLFISLKLAAAKIVLTVGGLFAGLATGREGPSVQVGAGIMHAARHWLPQRSSINDHGLIVAGGAAGIAAAFNTPLGGVMFAIEELSRRPEHRSSGLLIAAIVLAGLIGMSVFGNVSYFGQISAGDFGWSSLGSGVLIAVSTGLLGGLFARLLVQAARGGSDRFSQWRKHYPVRFAAGCGLVIAIIGVVSQGASSGSGYDATRALLEGKDPTNGFYVPLRFIATWLSAWSGVPGGVFAPALALGAGIGNEIAQLTGHLNTPALIALGMAGFLAAVTQAPITAFIIVMEMIEGHGLVLSLMACSVVASGVSRVISPPMYGAMAAAQLKRLDSDRADPQR
ncbi:MAG: chloride channel protein [Aquabacterium sp.]|nr:chloride channel protein [Aquabacterium sp.]